MSTIQSTTPWVLIGIAVVAVVLAIVIKKIVGKIIVLVLIILFIQKRPRGLFALKGRAVLAARARVSRTHWRRPMRGPDERCGI